MAHRLLAPALLAAAALPAHRATASQSYYVAHPFGFAVPVDAVATVEQTDDGFIVYPDGNPGDRSPTVVTVHWLPEQPDAAGAPLAETRQFDGFAAAYAVRSVTVGSGGTEYTLTVTRPLCGGTLEVREQQQSEFGSMPGFYAGWHMVEWARCNDDAD
ncbi:MAG: Tsi3 family protein [Alphaproteobacteria bacterium]